MRSDQLYRLPAYRSHSPIRMAAIGALAVLLAGSGVCEDNTPPKKQEGGDSETVVDEWRVSDAELNNHILIRTTLGTIRLALLADKAPRHCRAFLSWCKAGIYDGTLFNSIRRGFRIEVGHHSTRAKPISEQQAKLLSSLPPEAGEPFLIPGRVHLMPGEKDDESRSSAFVFCLGPSRALPEGVTVFARVVGSMETLHRIGDVHVNEHGFPIKPLAILKVTVIASHETDEYDPAYSQLLEDRYVHMAVPAHLAERRERLHKQPEKPTVQVDRSTILILSGLLAVFGWAVFFLSTRTDPRHIRAIGACLMAIGFFSVFIAFHDEARKSEAIGAAIFLGAVVTFWLLSHLERTEDGT